MAVAFSDTPSYTTVTATSFSFSHTCTGTNRALGVGTMARQHAATVTYNGVSLTNEINVNNGSARYCGLWTLLDPSSGANTLAGTASSTLSLLVGALSFTGAGGFGTAASATGTSTTASVTVTSATNEMVYDATTNGGTVDTVGSGQTERLNVSYANGNAMSTEPGASSVVMSWTISPSNAWASVGISVQEAAVAADNALAWCNF